MKQIHPPIASRRLCLSNIIWHNAALSKVSIFHPTDEVQSYLVIYQHGDDAPNIVFMLPHILDDDHMKQKEVTI